MSGVAIKKSPVLKFFNTFTDILNSGKKLLSKVICIFDDIPFVLQGRLPGDVGVYLLIAAGFIIFPLQIYDGIRELIKAIKLKREDKERKGLILASIIKIAIAVVGLIVSSSLLAFVLLKFSILIAAASITIPTIMAVVSGVELVQSINALKCSDTEDKKKEATRAIIYNSIFLGLGVAIAGLATLSTLTSLGVISFGVIPSAVLIGVVVFAFTLKLFEIVDKKKGHAMTNKIKQWWGSLFSEEPQLENVIRPDKIINKSPENAVPFTSATKQDTNFCKYKKNLDYLSKNPNRLLTGNSSIRLAPVDTSQGLIRKYNHMF